MAIIKSALVRGKSFGTYYQKNRLASAVANTTGSTQNFDVDVSDFDSCTILVQQVGAVSGDLSVTVSTFDSTGTVFPLGLSAASSSGPTFDGTANVNYLGMFDLRGLDTIRIGVKNNNAATKTINFVDLYAGVSGVDF